MYCMKCGCKIVPKSMKCSNCGADSTRVEYCGGFWGLVGSSKIVNDEIQYDKEMQTFEVPKEKRGQKTENELLSKIKENSKKQKLIISFLLGVVIIMLAVCIVQTFRSKSYARKYDSSKNTYSTLDIEYQDLKKKYDALTIEFESLQQQNKELKKIVGKERDYSDKISQKEEENLAEPFLEGEDISEKVKVKQEK